MTALFIISLVFLATTGALLTLLLAIATGADDGGAWRALFRSICVTICLLSVPIVTLCLLYYYS